MWRLVSLIENTYTAHHRNRKHRAKTTWNAICEQVGSKRQIEIVLYGEHYMTIKRVFENPTDAIESGDVYAELDEGYKLAGVYYPDGGLLSIQEAKIIGKQELYGV